MKLTKQSIFMEAIHSSTLNGLEVEGNQFVSIRLCEFALDFVTWYDWTDSRRRSCEDYVSFLYFKSYINDDPNQERIIYTSRVIMEETCSTRRGIRKIMSAVVPSCFISPFTY